MGSFDQQTQAAIRLDAIAQKVGFALWQIQELEGMAAGYFVLLVQAKKGMGHAEGMALVEKAQSKTLGVTVQKITKAGLLSSELETRFDNLLSERNWLVHRSRADSRAAVHHDADVSNLILRLEAIADESLDLMTEIRKLVESHALQHGVSKKQVYKNAKDLLEQWHSSDVE